MTLVLFALFIISALSVDVLVFGDSQGDVGPTFQVIADQLQQHNISHTVINVSVGGTLSCDWAEDPNSLAKAAKQQFKDKGPDLVWFTAGANDLAKDMKYHECLEGAETMDGAFSCLDDANNRVLSCTISLLEALWESFPQTKVGMYNYEIPCVEEGCLSADLQFLGGKFCENQADAVTCTMRQLLYWQSIYVDYLQEQYPRPQFTGMNLLGAVQQASGVPGASAGHPVMGVGSKCDWMIACVHPKYGTPTATAIGTAMWDLWLSNVIVEGNTSLQKNSKILTA